MTHKYKLNKWYPNVDMTKPDLPESCKVEIVTFNRMTNKSATERTTMRGYLAGVEGCWKWDFGKIVITAFRVTKYPDPVKKMTVEEISEELGYKVEVVAGIADL